MRITAVITPEATMHLISAALISGAGAKKQGSKAMKYYISLALAALRSDTNKDACTNQENRTKDMHTNKERIEGALVSECKIPVTVHLRYTVT
jgi:hypothetical protein